MEELTKNQSRRCRACAFGEVVNESTVYCPFGRCAAKRLQRYGKKKNHSRAAADKGDAGAGEKHEHGERGQVRREPPQRAGHRDDKAAQADRPSETQPVAE